MNLARTLLTGLHLSVLLCSTAAAQTEPAVPLKIVLPVPAGGGLDSLARALSDQLSENLRRPVIIESRPGAAGNIAAEQVARSAADGSTVLLAFDSVATINPFLYPKNVFVPERQLKPVALIGFWGFMLVINPSLNVKDVKELVAISKTRPLRAASSGSGSGSHLSLILFQRGSGLNAIHVPYRGAVPAVTDIMGGHVDAMFAVSTVAIPQIKAGKLRALGYSGQSRSPLAPEVPTLAEVGMRGYDFTGTYVFFVPAATPDSIVNQLYAAIQDAVGRPEVRERIIQQDVIPAVMPAADAAAWIEHTRSRWGPIINEARVTAE